MKKLMIAAAIVCAAVVSQAANANWKIQGYDVYDGTGSTADSHYLTGTVMFFDSAKMAQSDLFDLIVEGTVIDSTTAGYVGQTTLDEGAFIIQKQPYDEQGSGSHTFYMAAILEDKVYFSQEISNTAGTTSTAKTLNFLGQNDGEKTFSASLPTGSGFQGAGYWSTVPEPTSGLLLLLGVAGLALRRRRA